MKQGVSIFLHCTLFFFSQKESLLLIFRGRCLQASFSSEMADLELLSQWMCIKIAEP